MHHVSIHNLSARYYDLATLDRIVSEVPELRLSAEVETAISRGAAYVKKISGSKNPIYGVNTGFGVFCNVVIPEDELPQLQVNHLTSHACGVGEIISERTTRMVLLAKLLTFRTGRTGISVPVVQRLLDFWNESVLPVIPSKGSVGASGDLAPLAQMALPIIGEGQVRCDGKIIDARSALNRRGWLPLKLGPKEGLALTNGVQYINGVAAECLVRSRHLIRAADIIASLTIQGFSAAKSFYQASLHATSFHRERGEVAANLRVLLDGSNHFELKHCDPAMEDPYSIRCLPQVHAAVRATHDFARKTVEDECNSVSDNPLVFPEEDQVLTGGNLHGESTAFAADFMAIAASELASISERRTYQLLSGQRGLPSFLVQNGGLNSGLMIPQYTAAALVNQNKVLATPASIDTIPTCHLQEDHVSMGGTSVLKLNSILDNCEYVLAIELITAVQATDLNEGLRLSNQTKALVEEFRQSIPFLASDRLMKTDIEQSRRFILENRTFINLAERLR